MSAIFEFPLTSETLTADEVRAITGCTRRADQVAWLAREGWAYVRTPRRRARRRALLCQATLGRHRPAIHRRANRMGPRFLITLI